MSKMRKSSPSLSIVIDAAAALLLGLSLLAFLGRFHWSLDLFSHFRVQYMQLCLPIIGCYLWKRLNRRAIAVTALALLNYAFVLPFYFGEPQPPTQPTTRAMLVNLNAGNDEFDLALRAIEQINPDLLLLEEATPKWLNKLRALETNFPYRITEARADSFGIALFSKLPLQNESIEFVNGAGFPSILATVQTKQGNFSFIGTHPPPPIGKIYSASRNDQLAAIADLASQQKGPVLMMGDLNCSPWSSHFRAVSNHSGLINSMNGFGFQPSWPQGSFFKIPIDHAFHSAELIIHQRQTGPDVGSDHLPLIIDFTVSAE